MRPAVAPRRAPPAALPWPVAVGAVVVLTASLLVSKVVLDALLGLEWPVAVYVVLLAAIGYGPSLVWAGYASHRWGTGRLLDDVGGRPRWSDLGWGPVVWLAAIGTQVAVGAIVIGIGVPLSSNTDGIAELDADRTYVVAIVVAAVVAAPLVEELVFRGLVLRGLLGSMPALVAILLQGVLFGVAHIDPVRGAGNLGLALILTGVGIAFGGAAYLLRRIGPTVVAHAIFNGVVMAIVLSGLGDDLRDRSDDLVGAPPVATSVVTVEDAVGGSGAG